MELVCQVVCYVSYFLLCRHVTSLGKQTTPQSNSTPTVKVTTAASVNGAWSSHSCVKYYPSAGTEVSSYHFKYCVLRRRAGGRLSGWSSFSGEGASNHVTFRGRTFGLHLCTLTWGQGDVAYSHHVTKANQNPNEHHGVFKSAFVLRRAHCSINDYTKYLQLHVSKWMIPPGWSKVIIPRDSEGTIMALLLSLANRKQQKQLQHPHHSKCSELYTKLNYSVWRIKTHLHQ